MTPDVILLEAPSPGTLPFEIVERKGLGHPDTICDALAEEVSRALSRFYLDRCGFVLHHNVDKALLCGGAARPVLVVGLVRTRAKRIAACAVAQSHWPRVPPSADSGPKLERTPDDLWRVTQFEEQ